jgi:hypothetical protein
MPVEFAYAQARAQARHGARLGAEAWGLLESSVGLAQFLHLCRGTTLAPRVEHFSAATSPHAIERSLRRDWHREVDSATHWVPLRWRAAVAWTGWLAELPALGHLLDGGGSLPWMAADPVLPAFSLEDADARRRSIEETLPGAATDAGAGPAIWLSHWRRLWPDDGAADPGLHRLVSAAERYGIGGEGDAAGDWRENLERRAVGILRRHREQPVTVFCHLLLCAVELHRLRQGLLRRALFNDLAAEVAA